MFLSKFQNIFSNSTKIATLIEFNEKCLFISEIKNEGWKFKVSNNTRRQRLW